MQHVKLAGNSLNSKKKGIRMSGECELPRIKQYFYERIRKTSDCWYWIGYIGPHGYGQMMRNMRAHRVSYEIHKEKIPKGMYVLHSCDNRKCVNPDHLFLGTHLDNIKDMNDKNRGNFSGIGKGENWGENCGNSKLTECQVLNIREKLKLNKNQSEIARFYGVKRATINDIARNKTWRDL